jgi:hypothetical protein
MVSTDYRPDLADFSLLEAAARMLDSSSQLFEDEGELAQRARAALPDKNLPAM